MKKENAKKNKADKKSTNVADVMIVLLCILAIAGMVLRFGFLEKIEQRAHDTEATVSVLIEDISKSSADMLCDGDVLRFSESGDEIGLIKSPNIKAAIYYFYTNDGQVVAKPSTDDVENAEGDVKVNVEMQLSVKGEMTEKGFMLNSTKYIAPNMTLYTETEGLSVSMTVMNIVISE